MRYIMGFKRGTYIYIYKYDHPQVYKACEIKTSLNLWLETMIYFLKTMIINTMNILFFNNRPIVVGCF